MGVSEYCDYPEEAKTKPKVGGYYTPNIEAIVALNPDLVLTDGYVPELSPSSRAWEFRFAVIHPKDINDILKDIELLGNVTGSQKEATRTNQRYEESYEAVVKYGEQCLTPQGVLRVRCHRSHQALDSGARLFCGCPHSNSGR